MRTEVTAVGAESVSEAPVDGSVVHLSSKEKAFERSEVAEKPKFDEAAVKSNDEAAVDEKAVELEAVVGNTISDESAPAARAEGAAESSTEEEEEEEKDISEDQTAVDKMAAERIVASERADNEQMVRTNGRRVEQAFLETAQSEEQVKDEEDEEEGAAEDQVAAERILAQKTETVNVTLINMSGATIFGPCDIDRCFTIKELKLLFERGRPKSVVFGARHLADTATFDAFPESVLFTVTYSDALEYDSGGEVEDAIRDQYTFWEKLHTTTFSTIYKASRIGQNPPEFVTIKKILFESDEGIPITAIREVESLKQCDHPNVVRLHDVLCNGMNMYLVMEHFDLDLRTYLRACGPLSDLKRLRAMARMCFRAIEHCHSHAIMHRDIKPDNFLVNASTMHVKLAEFDLSRRFTFPSSVLTHDVVTLWYRPPEILLGQSVYGPLVDIWSMGVVFVEMASGRPVFAGSSEIETLFLIFRYLGTPTEELWPGLSSLPYFKPTFPKWKAEGVENRLLPMSPGLGTSGLRLVMACLMYDSVQRPSARECAEHQFFMDGCDAVIG